MLLKLSENIKNEINYIRYRNDENDTWKPEAIMIGANVPIFRLVVALAIMNSTRKNDGVEYVHRKNNCCDVATESEKPE